MEYKTSLPLISGQRAAHKPSPNPENTPPVATASTFNMQRLAPPSPFSSTRPAREARQRATAVPRKFNRTTSLPTIRPGRSASPQKPRRLRKVDPEYDTLVAQMSLQLDVTDYGETSTPSIRIWSPEDPFYSNADFFPSPGTCTRCMLGECQRVLPTHGTREGRREVLCEHLQDAHSGMFEVYYDLRRTCYWCPWDNCKKNGATKDALIDHILDWHF